jgi:hypothetical protein
MTHLLPGILLFVIGLLCFYLAECGIRKESCTLRGLICSRGKNAVLFWAGVLSYVLAGAFLFFSASIFLTEREINSKPKSADIKLKRYEPYYLDGKAYKLATEELSSEQFKNTEVTPYLRHPISYDKNLVYCSSFQLAWNNLIDEFVKEPVKLMGQDETADRLNERLFNARDLSENSYLAIAGEGRQAIDSILKQMKERFGATPTINIWQAISGGGPTILLYAYLEKTLLFKSKFSHFERRPVSFKGTFKAKAFGVESFEKDLIDQVLVRDYQNEDDFIVELTSPTFTDQIILAKIKPEENLLLTIQKVQKRMESPYGEPRLKVGEELKIPDISFKLLKSYDELRKPVLNETLKKRYVIFRALQSIWFNLDEEGVKLKSQAFIALTYSLSLEENVLRRFIFDKPFLLLLKEKSAEYPYLVLWVGNEELLVKY